MYKLQVRIAFADAMCVSPITTHRQPSWYSTISRKSLHIRTEVQLLMRHDHNFMFNLVISHIRFQFQIALYFSTNAAHTQGGKFLRLSPVRGGVARVANRNGCMTISLFLTDVLGQCLVWLHF